MQLSGINISLGRNQYVLWKILFYTMLLEISQPAVAYELYPSEKDFYEKIPLVSSATRLTQNKLTAPASVTIIDRKMIEASGAIEIPDLLRLVPGMQVAQANGNLFTVTYHGLSIEIPNQMQVLVDGRSVYTTLYNLVDWNALSIEINDIDRIEVVRGSNTPAYGENAFRCSINIITRQAYDDPGFTAQVTSGYANTRRTYLRYTGTASDIDYKISAGRKSDDGYKSLADDDKDIDYVNTRVTFSPTLKDSLDLQAGYSNGKVGAWGDVNLPDVTLGTFDWPYRDKSVRSYYIYGNWSRMVGNGTLQIAINRDRLEWNDRFPVDLDPVAPGEIVSFGLYSGQAERTHLELQHNLDLDHGVRLSWGGSLREDKLKDEIILDQNGYKTEYSDRFFTNLEWTIRQDWILNSGAMYEHNTMVGAYVSPRIGINHLLSEDKMIRASITRSRRSPSIYEFYNHNDIEIPSSMTDFLTLYTADPSLKEETMTDYEIGFIDNIKEWKTNVDIKIFREEMKGIIKDVLDKALTDAQGQSAYVWLNSGDVTVDGVEFQLSFFPEPHTTLNLMYCYETLEGSLLRQINPTKSVDQFRQERIAGGSSGGGFISDYVPAETVSAQLVHEFPGGLESSFGVYHVGHMTWGGNGDILDRYDRIDFHLTKKTEISGNLVALSLTIQNFGGDYHEFEDENIFDNRIYLTAEIRH